MLIANVPLSKTFAPPQITFTAGITMHASDRLVKILILKTNVGAGLNHIASGAVIQMRLNVAYGAVWYASFLSSKVAYALRLEKNSPAIFVNPMEPGLVFK